MSTSETTTDADGTDITEQSRDGRYSYKLAEDTEYNGWQVRPLSKRRNRYPDGLTNVFEELRENNIIVDEGISDCSSCMWGWLTSKADDLEEKDQPVAGLVGFNSQADLSSPYLGYSGRENGLSTDEVADLVIELLEKHDVEYYWTGTKDRKINVNPDWCTECGDKPGRGFHKVVCKDCDPDHCSHD